MQAEISIKNLQYLNDLLGSEKLKFAKLKVYIENVTNPNMKQLFTTFMKNSEKNYKILFEYLKSHQN